MIEVVELKATKLLKEWLAFADKESRREHGWQHNRKIAELYEAIAELEDLQARMQDESYKNFKNELKQTFEKLIV